METATKHKEIIDKIFQSLEPMYGIAFEENNGSLDICKDNIKFGLIKNNAVFFLNKDDVMEKIDQPLKIHNDKILFAATKAYWQASKR